jgi:putative DNA primase/helicase
MTPLLDAALDYAARGWHVFPIWPIRNGQCACGKPCGRDAGKHPVGRLAPHGVRDATTDGDIITHWWADTPDASIGIATGAVSGIIVLDVDGEDGEASLAALERAHGPIPETAIVLTGKGRHLYFSHPGVPVPNRVRVAPGLDVRGDGGYVVAPPSAHA